jgi:HD superfamily phosphodiesterase
MRILPRLVNFALITVRNLRIDESHGVSHSLNVLHHAHNILESELVTSPYLESQRDIIYSSAVIHDLCDKKYMDEFHGIQNIHKFLVTKTGFSLEDVSIIERIISTMSYSKVKKQGFPYLGDYERAYHIVREADLLSAYDIDRSIIYNMNNVNEDFLESLENALQLFEGRVLHP